MPYIDKDKREPINSAIEIMLPMLESAGDLNYAISRLVHRHLQINVKKVSYSTLSAVHAVMTDAADEFQRNVIVPYERIKKAENGPVSELDAIEDVDGTVKVVQNIAAPTTADDVVARLLAVMQGMPGQPRDPNVFIENIVATPKPTEAPVPAAPPPSTSTKRRAPSVVGAEPGAGERRAPSDTPVAPPPPETPAAPKKRISVPRGHTPVKMDSHTKNIWEEATRGDGEDPIAGIEGI